MCQTIFQVKKESWLRNVLGARLPPRPLPAPGSEGESKVDFDCVRRGWELIDQVSKQVIIVSGGGGQRWVILMGVLAIMAAWRLGDAQGLLG